MKKVLYLIVGVFLVSALLESASIRVSEPNASSEWCLGSTHMIIWTPSGDMPNRVTIRLRRAGSPSTEAAVLVISPDTSWVDPFPWPIPNTVRPGRYFIRIKTIGGAAGSTDVTGDSADFTIKSCVQVIQAPPPPMQIDPRLLQHTLTMPVTFYSTMKQKTRHSWNCLATMGIGAIDVPPSEMLVGFFNRREHRGALCADECVSQIYRGSPLWDATRLATLIGKTIVKATLSFRHKNSESSTSLSFCLKHIYWYSGHFGDENPPPTISPPLPTVLSGDYRIDVTDMMRNWLHEKDPSYHGERHNYHMEFVGLDERMEFNSQKCLSWFDNGSLEIKYTD